MTRKKEPYYTLKINTLSSDYHDRDEILLHAMMQILVDFIDEECSPGVINWDHDLLHKKVRKEMQTIYDWWTKKRPARTDILDIVTEPLPDFDNLQNLTPKYRRQLDKWNKIEEKQNTEDQQMLHRLIDIRDYLWT